MARVFVGMSGGVDSSLTAALLVEQGHDVTGVYMKNWSEDLPGMKCPWAEDLADAKRVAVQLGIDFLVFDFEKDYRDRVVQYMIDEYKRGRTPNPDIMCNQEIKFRLFFDTAVSHGAEYIATGHYARTKDGQLLQAVDSDKDQTYFLYRVSKQALLKTIFPLGEYTKSQVREMAKQRNLWTAGKKESMGVCFVGRVGMRDFLGQYVETTVGNVIDRRLDKIIGKHDGAIFYTLGQRHGLELGGGLPYYVVGKNMSKNEVYVSQQLDSPEIWQKSIELDQLHWIDDAPKNTDIEVRIRHRAPLIKASLNGSQLDLDEAQRAVTAGQSAVIYSGEECLGGGIISL
ncbi:tRNA 2-thiouridine(34) synthase MnmA [Candidatus Saccharibacteria bacterium]|nr:tRNA 2-thiouridine(34) synthase MnmA [Candidatus Saccharibacteria bacterium]